MPQNTPLVIENPVGSGPYQFVSGTESEIQLETHTDYWGRIPPIKRVTFKIITDNAARLASYFRGELDFVTSFWGEDLSEYSGSIGSQFLSEPGVYVSYFQFRIDRPPFNDRRIRQAINLAINREELLKQAASGMAHPASQLLSPQVFGYVPGLRVPNPDPEKARALLREAGYHQGLEIEVHQRMGRRSGRALVSQLEKVGIRMNLVELEWPELYAKLHAGEIDSYIGSWGCPSGDASELFDNKVHTADPNGVYGQSNTSGYSNPLLDGLIEDAGSTFSVKERKEIFSQATKILLEDHAIIPLLVSDQVYMVSPELTWEPRLDGLVLAHDMSFN